MAKMDEGRFQSCIGDTPEQIAMCMNCTLEECIDCLSANHAAVKDVSDCFDIVEDLKQRKKKLTKVELKVLRAYPDAKNDYELSKMIGSAQSTACTVRKKLGLPVIKWTTEDMRKRLVEIWMKS